jgi:type IX secretion system PorP/SprF family membrane protein
MLACLLTKSARAQDIHFSQFFSTPMFTNPGNTGMSGQGLRFANTYRNQWSKLGVPFKTLYTSIDNNINILNQNFGIGGLIVHDKSTSLDLSIDEVMLSISYSKIINNQQFTLAIQPGLGFKSYNLSELTFGSQFDDVNEFFNSKLSNSESSLASNLHYFDMNVGIFWRTLIRNVMPSAGFSISHVFMPVVSFSSDTLGSRLARKFSFNSQVIIPVNNSLELIPSLLYSTTSGVNELLLGGIEGHTVNDFVWPVKKIYAINMLRINSFKNFDSFILGGGVQFSKFDIGVTYDINISPLYRATHMNGAFEISLVFKGQNRVNKKVNNPCFIY